MTEYPDELEIEDEALELAAGGGVQSNPSSNSIGMDPITLPGGYTVDPTTGQVTPPPVSSRPTR
ncbi:hypothetical protein [Aurantimicrobium minutum]|uniref:hypothetical protein n=1 Tax=Aurantimicrobium minutum TaxID=708131 RepID=UPI00247643C1|nr:hypothetical protein [Aurantimicrobium minutum]MDH6423412.1 hypothetical protein [Aurantimicrobium minutum]